jgi:hypothetical protein
MSLTIARRCTPAFLALWAGAATLLPAPAMATAIGIQVVTDTPERMTGVVSGSFLDTNFGSAIFSHISVAGGGYYDTYSYSFAQVGSNWHVSGQLTQDIFFAADNSVRFITYDLSLNGQHMVKVHDNETAPNNLELSVYANNLTGETGTPPPSSGSKLTDHVPHPLTMHTDTMKLSPIDLNGAGAGVVNSYQVAAGFELVHPVPEPETYALMLAGLGVLGFVGRRKR